jgi:3-phenylpropionate/trans-cinnamate dioxygenase ferredoxin reductase subunit
MMDRIIVAGGSIAGVTAASTLRSEGWSGELIVLSDEHVMPYSRVPLSKGVLAGTQQPETATLAALPKDVDLRLGQRAVALHSESRTIELAGGERLNYDGLVIATGSRARRLATAGQQGELVVRTMADAQAISRQIPTASTAIVVGGGFLGMEVASTLLHHGLSVTVVDREPPLRRVLGEWLSDLLVTNAYAQGMKFVLAENGVELLGNPVRAVGIGQSRELKADLIISAVGDLPNTEWLETSGLRLAGGVVIDDACRVSPGIVAAGDVAVQEVEPAVFRRTPHWTNAVVQGQAAARALLDPTRSPYLPDHYFWTEQFGVDLKVSGRLPLNGPPRILEGDPSEMSTLAQWWNGDIPIAAAALNHKMPVVRLKALAALHD